MNESETLPNGSIHTQYPKSAVSAKTSIKSDITLGDSKNWLIHYHFSRQNFDTCKLVIKEELAKSNGKGEYAIFVKGIILRQEGKIQESLECFQKCCSLSPKNEDNMKQIARSLYLLGRQRLAIEAFHEATILSKKPDWTIYHNLGLCMVNMGEWEKAKEYLRQAVHLGKHESSYLALAKVHMAQNDPAEAGEVLRAGCELLPGSVDLAVSSAILHMDLADHQKAFEKFGTALALDPTCSRALLAVGALMQGHGELDVALAKYKSAASLLPESASLWNNLGMCFFGKRRYVSAVSCLKRANCFAPFDWKILLNLGLVHLATQQYASAFHYLSSAVNLDPSAGPVFLPLAVTLVYLGDRQNARFAFEEAIAMTDSPAAAINFALFLNEEGDRTGAVKMYSRYQTQDEKVTAIEPEVKDLAMKLRSLLSIPGDVIGSPAADIADNRTEGQVRLDRGPVAEQPLGDLQTLELKLKGELPTEGAAHFYTDKV